MFNNPERSLLGVSNDCLEAIDALGRLLAQHKLVPFVGAGASRQHLGFAGRELAEELAQILGKPAEPMLSKLADDYIDAHGEQAFAGFLRSKLVVAELDEPKVPIHRLLLSLSPRVVYTTNQDNLFELTAAHYGRPYRRVVTLQDLSDAAPGEPMLIKFHGDPDVPSSLVFGTRSYNQRMATERHPFDIRLQSDLLGKQLLFIGYSLQDENVGKLLKAMKKVFGDDMPKSYLMAFEYDPLMDNLTSSYGVEIINPVTFFREPVDVHTAFERLLKAVCDSTIKHQIQQGLETLFNAGTSNPRVVTEFELDALARIVESESFNDGASAFRGLIDQARIPDYMLERCTNLFQQIVERADPESEEEMGVLQGMLFNFRVPPISAMTAMAYVMAACNRRPRVVGYDHFGSLVCPAIADETRPIAAAMAVAILGERKEPITDQFRHLASSWFRGFDSVPDAARHMVEQMIAVVWPDALAVQSPLHQPRLSIRLKGFHEIVKDMMANLPRKLQTPNE